MSEVLAKLGVASHAAAAAAARPVYAARLAALLEKPASDHPGSDLRFKTMDLFIVNDGFCIINDDLKCK